MADNYSTYVFKQGDFELSKALTDYKVSSEDGLSYKITARFSFDTPIGEIIPFLEAGGSVSFTRDGLRKQIVLETDNGPTRS